MDIISLQRLRKIALLAALINGLILSFASLVGVLRAKEIYPNGTLQATYLTNDVANLCVVLPVLAVGIYLLGRSRLSGIYWLSAGLALITYNGIAYLFGVPFSSLSVVYMAEIVFSLAGFALFIKNVNWQVMQSVSAVKIPEKLIGGVLMGFGLLFVGRSLLQLIGRAAGSDLAVDIADLCITPLWIISGIAIWRKRPFGYVFAPIMLALCCLLMLGLLLFFLLQPVLLNVNFAGSDFGVIFVFALICFFPFVKTLLRVSMLRVD